MSGLNTGYGERGCMSAPSLGVLMQPRSPRRGARRLKPILPAGCLFTLIDHRFGHTLVNRFVLRRILIEPGAQIVRLGIRRGALLDRAQQAVRLLRKLGDVGSMFARRRVRQFRLHDRERIAEVMGVDLPGLFLFVRCLVIVEGGKIDQESADVIGYVVRVVLF